MEGPCCRTLKRGEQLSLHVVAKGSQPLHFLWSVNGQELAGATNDVLVVGPAGPWHSGTYRVSVWNATGTNQAIARVQVDGVTHRLMPIPVDGWDTDVVTELGGSPLTTDLFDAQAATWIEAGYDGHPDGLPTSRRFTSAVDPQTLFELQPYDKPNVLFLTSPALVLPATIAPPNKPSGELLLRRPAAYSALAVAASSGNNGGVGDVVISFEDGSESRAFDLVTPDWWTIPERAGLTALAGVGRWVVCESTNFYESAGDFGFGLYQTEIDLESEGLDHLAIKRLTFTKPPRPDTWPLVRGPATTAIFAVSGAISEPRFTRIEYRQARKVQLELTRPAGVGYRVESSTDCMNWAQVHIFRAGPEKVVCCEDLAVGDSGCRYYRAVELGE